MEKRSIRLSLALVWIFALALLLADGMIWPLSALFLKSMPFFNKTDRYFLIGCLYLCNIPGFTLLLSMGKLLKNLDGDRVFVPENVGILRRVSICCFAACLICFAGGFFVYMLFLVSAAAGFMGLIVRIVKNVFQEAIPMRDELDYTV